MASIPRSRRIRPSSTRDSARASRRPDKGVARYYRLYELLSAALQDGTIPPGSALPSEPQLCARHGISRTTVRHALDRLELEGRILRRRGSGTYARPQRAPLRLPVELHAPSEIPAGQESRTTTTTLRFDTAPVPHALRELAVEIGPMACVLERLLTANGEPLSLTAAYLPEPVGRRLQRPVRTRASLLMMLDRLETPAAAVRYSIGAVPADADAARKLRMPLGSALIRVRAVLTGDAGQLLAVSESLCRSDRLQLKVLELHRG
ncbi:MAG TPA: GntR family transcriptional regulator [Steroidobacteraceae bacterium]|nr:GntR family transcriptional regulator [Steroidobacteraceae bacterium]